MANVLFSCEKSTFGTRLVHLLKDQSFTVTQSLDAMNSIQLIDKQEFDLIITSPNFYLPDNTPFTRVLARHKKSRSKTLTSILLTNDQFSSQHYYPEIDQFLNPSMPDFKIIQVLTACLHAVQYPFYNEHLNKEKIEGLEQAIVLRDKEIFSLYTLLVRKKSEMRSLSELLEDENYPQPSDKIETAKKQLNEFLKDESFEEPVFSYFNTHIPRFSDKLSTLNTKEKRHCALIKMGLENRDIASILMVSTDSIKKAHLRIKKKIGLSQPKSLRSFLLEL
ncbi:MAG TPA: hypothetical protein VK177_17155 [Flavobacteriales bacterium]|nr:hypothetical protein [Flavobacteriales bacterium]